MCPVQTVTHVSGRSLIFLSIPFSLLETGILRPNWQEFTRAIRSLSAPISQTA